MTTITQLKARHKALREKMLRVQAAYAKAVKKGGVPESKLRAMADKGFAAEIATLKALKTLQKFQKLH